MHTFTVHTSSAKFLAISIGDAMGRFFRDVDRSVPVGTLPEEAAPLLAQIVLRHGITLEEWSP
jgi:hypothetical protein